MNNIAIQINNKIKKEIEEAERRIIHNRNLEKEVEDKYKKIRYKGLKEYYEKKLEYLEQVRFKLEEIIEGIIKWEKKENS